MAFELSLQQLCFLGTESWTQRVKGPPLPSPAVLWLNRYIVLAIASQYRRQPGSGRNAIGSRI